MRAVILCEGTTDLLMIQYVLQYRYGWEYEGFLENAENAQGNEGGHRNGEKEIFN